MAYAKRGGFVSQIHTFTRNALEPRRARPRSPTPNCQGSRCDAHHGEVCTRLENRHGKMRGENGPGVGISKVGGKFVRKELSDASPRIQSSFVHGGPSCPCLTSRPTKRDVPSGSTTPCGR